MWLQGFKVAYAAFCKECVSMYAVRNEMLLICSVVLQAIGVKTRVIVIKNQKGMFRRFLATSEGAGQKVTLTRITSSPTSHHQCRVKDADVI